jgi:hypothetical protein
MTIHVGLRHFLFAHQIKEITTIAELLYDHNLSASPLHPESP